MSSISLGFLSSSFRRIDEGSSRLFRIESFCEEKSEWEPWNDDTVGIIWPTGICGSVYQTSGLEKGTHKADIFELCVMYNMATITFCMDVNDVYTPWGTRIYCRQSLVPGSSTLPSRPCGLVSAYVCLFVSAYWASVLKSRWNLNNSLGCTTTETLS